MITKNFPINLQIGEENILPNKRFKVVQNDIDAYSLTVRLFNNITEVDYSGIDHATITFTRWDNVVVQGDMAVGEDSLTYSLGTSEIACEGTVAATIQLFDANDARLTPPSSFKFTVIGDAITSSAVQSTSEFPVLQQMAHNEVERISAEELRISAEESRSTAEGLRASAEALRANAETSRNNAETARTTAETNRATAETNRATAENSRATAETARATAEQARATAEVTRQAGYTAMNASLAENTNQVMPVVYHTTLTGAVNAITIQNDDNGKTLDLARAQLNIIVPAGSTSPVGTNIYAFGQLNNISTGYFNPYTNNDNNDSFYVGAYKSQYGISETNIAVLDNAAIIKTISACSDGTSRTSGQITMSALKSGITSINKIYIILTSPYTIPAGSIIELRGSKE